MKSGKPQIHNLPINDVTSLEAFAFDVLRECNIAAAPGSTFGSVAENYIRVSLAASGAEIERGVREMCSFADNQ
ncbi:MAG TPA: hypothetical protein VEI53_14535 [Ktedonobacteraceae bacterium]|nr:hypothetical protein [Ktedonobacteraceae bacterium]